MKINIIILYISNSYLAWFCEGEKEANCFALFFPKVQSTWQLCLVLYIFINRTCTAICYVFNAISIMVNGLSQYYRALWTQSRAWPQTNKQRKVLSKSNPSSMDHDDSAQFSCIRINRVTKGPLPHPVVSTAVHFNLFRGPTNK